MSLNGLDDPKLKEAHEAAAADAGGWYVIFRINTLDAFTGCGLPISVPDARQHED